MNDNTDLIAGLRAAADFLETKPAMPALYGTISFYPTTKARFLEFVEQVGSFTKQWSDDYLTIGRLFGKHLDVHCTVDRNLICTKRVVWDCPDEGLMSLINDKEAVKALGERTKEEILNDELVNEADRKLSDGMAQ